MKLIYKTRREWFGGVVYSENPGYTMFVDHAAADTLGIPPDSDLTAGLFSAPLDVHISLTNRCNLGCKGCYAIDSRDAAKDMPFGLARAVIDRLAEMNVFTIAFGGGEPFLHPDLFEIASYAREKRIVPNITTNALTITEAVADKCRAFGNVHISCHHASELPRLAEPVRLLKKAGIDLGLNVLVSAETFEDIPRIWAWCAKNGIARVLLLKFKLTRNNQACRALAISPEREREIFPLIRRLAKWRSIMPMLDCSFFPAIAFHSPKKKSLEFFDVNGCVGGNAILAVTVDGQYKPCSFCSALSGDVLSLSRKSWKHDPALNEFRRKRMHEACKECNYEDLCFGGCRFAASPCCGK